MGKGGGGGGQTTSTGTTYTTNLPEYAQPYVETMLGATQKQLFQTQETPGVYDPNTGQTSAGTTEITGFQPYTPYSTDPSKSVAGFSPLQQQAQQTVAGMQTPGAYGQAQGLAGMAGMGQFGTAQQAGALGNLGMLGASAAAPAFGAGQQYMQGITDPNTMAQYMSPYQQNVTDIAKMNAVREAQIAGNQANLGAARQGTYGGARQALAGSERERNLLSNLSNIQAQGSQSAYDRALAQQQFGANLGLQGIQTGLQGISTGMQGIGQGIGAQQAGYAGAGQAASTMGSLAGQEFGTQKDIVGLQTQAGAQQQAQQQQIVNQAIQDYANAQQYPMMQLGFMSNMLRGLPMQSTNTQQYVAAPNQLTQGIGALGAGANIYSAFSGNPTRVAEGGQIKSYAEGGITSYDVGGNVKSDLSNIRSAEELREIARNTTSDRIREEALRFAKMREMGLAGGGIVAFKEGQTVYRPNKTLEDFIIPDSDELKARRESDVAAAMTLKAERDAEALKNPPANNSIMAAVTSNILKDDRNYTFSPAEPPSLKSIPADTTKKVVDNTIDASGRNALGERPGEGTRKDEAPAAPAVTTKKDDGIKAVKLKDEAAPAVTTKKDDGIKAARKDEAAVTPSTEGISRKRANIPGISPTEQAMLNEAEGKQQTLAEILAEMETEKRKYVGPDTRPEERSKLMAEKVNMQDEDARNRKLQMAQFFASWGSTPGSTLQAAMVAVNKHIPTIIASDKEARKAQNEVDKIIRELNKAERLEKEGDFDAAYKIKSEQSKRYEDLYKTVLQNKGQRDAAAIRTDGAGGAKLLSALKYQESIRSKIQSEKNDKNGTYYQARTFLDNLQDKEGKAYKDKDLKDRVDKARATIRALDLEHAGLIQKADKTVNFYKGVADIDVGNMPSDSTTTSSVSEDKKVNLPAGVVPPNSKYIGTFKGNPVYQLEDGTKKVVKQVS
jgi:hypothetical protein